MGLFCEQGVPEWVDNNNAGFFCKRFFKVFAWTRCIERTRGLYIPKIQLLGVNYCTTT